MHEKFYFFWLFNLGCKILICPCYERGNLDIMKHGYEEVIDKIITSGSNHEVNTSYVILLQTTMNFYIVKIQVRNTM